MSGRAKAMFNLEFAQYRHQIKLNSTISNKFTIFSGTTKSNIVELSFRKLEAGGEQEICFPPTLQWEKENSSDMPKLNHNPQDSGINYC